MIYIKDLKLNNYRGFKSIKFQFKPQINILIGKNGSGKTSIVESVGYLCLGKSFKNAKDKEVLKFDEEYFNIIGNIHNKNDNKIVVSYDGTTKKIKNGENLYKTLSEHVGIYRLISFSPDDLDIIKGSPSIRRRFIDVFISQYDNCYLKMLSEYKKVLKIRNEFLKKIENNQYDDLMLDIINEKLINSGKEIINLRKKHIETLNQKVKDVSKALTNGKSDVNLQYFADVIEGEFEKVIKNNIKVDIASKTTSRGPQRDDVKVEFDGKNAASFASQGQVRIAVLAIKLAVYELFSQINDNIIIILDDVFSELDLERQEHLMKYIKKAGQVFITTTEISKLPKELIEESNIVEIKEGENNV